jgi:hypothetical protein
MASVSQLATQRDLKNLEATQEDPVPECCFELWKHRLQRHTSLHLPEPSSRVPIRTFLLQVTESHYVSQLLSL